MIKVKNEVKVYEYNSKDVAFSNTSIVVENHWNEDRKVVLEINGERYTIVADDLLCAIKNAINSNR